MSKPILLIFDIDGTLTDAGGLGRKALESAALEIYGVRESTKGIVPHGMTDFLIFEQMLKIMGVEPSDVTEEFELYCEVYVRHFRAEIEKSKYPVLLKGVRVTLDRLNALDEVYMAVGTGNIRESAEIKLAKQDIAKYFPVGGFGDGDFPRAEIIRRALERSIEHHRIDFVPDNCWVIGDTPLDIAAGKANGMRTVGVASSIFSEDALKDNDPDLVLLDLLQSDVLINTILNH